MTYIILTILMTHMPVHFNMLLLLQYFYNLGNPSSTKLTNLSSALTKEMTREDLEEWHQLRMEALIGGKVSLLALETMPGSLEVNFSSKFSHLKAISSFHLV